MPDREDRPISAHTATASQDEVEELRREIQQLREEQSRKGVGGGDRRKDAETELPFEPPRRPFYREHPIKALVGLLVVAAILVGAFLWWKYTQTYEQTDDAQIDSPLNPISVRVAGTVQAVHFHENEIVQKGKLLVELDPRDYEVALQRAQANVAQAQAQIRAETPTVPITTTTTESRIASSTAGVANARAAVEAAERDYESQLAKVAQAEANNARAQADLKRYSALVAKDEVSREEYDQRVAASKASAAGLASERAAASASQRIIDQRKAALTQAETALASAQRTAPQELSIQRANLELRRASAGASQSALEAARLELEYTKVYAPVDGVIGRKAVEVGQRVQPGQQLLAIVPLNDIWITANFKETQLRRMRAGQGATIHVDAFDRDYEGYVDSMPPATAARFSILPPENASGNYVKVVQRLPVRLRFKEGQDREHQLRPGMSVVPKVWIK